MVRRAVKNAPGSVSMPSHLVSHNVINRSIDCMELSALGFFFVSGCLLSSVGTFHSLHLPTHAHFHMEGEISGHSPPATALPRNLSRSPKGPRCRWRWQPKCRWDSAGRGRQKIPGCHSEQCQFKLLPWTSLQGRRAPVSPASPASPH